MWFRLWIILVRIFNYYTFKIITTAGNYKLLHSITVYIQTKFTENYVPITIVSGKTLFYYYKRKAGISWKEYIVRLLDIACYTIHALLYDFHCEQSSWMISQPGGMNRFYIVLSIVMCEFDGMFYRSELNSRKYLRSWYLHLKFTLSDCLDKISVVFCVSRIFFFGS